MITPSSVTPTVNVQPNNNGMTTEVRNNCPDVLNPIVNSIQSLHASIVCMQNEIVGLKRLLMDNATKYTIIETLRVENSELKACVDLLENSRPR